MARKATHMLSKSRFLAGLQCPLQLWFQCYNRELATQLYPGGVLIEEDHLRRRPWNLGFWVQVGS